jgi:hypothetical protein
VDSVRHVVQRSHCGDGECHLKLFLFVSRIPYPVGSMRVCSISV